MEDFVAIGVIDPLSQRISDDVKEGAAFSIDLGNGVSLGEMPSWVRETGALETLNLRQRHWVKEAPFCLWTSRKEPGSHDDLPGDIQRLADCNLAIWLAHP